MNTTEPSITVGNITAVAAALVALAVAFWPDLLTEDQKVAILAMVAVAAPIIVGALVRGQVTANANVVERVNTGGFVVAGEANDIVAEGARVRALGTTTEDNPPAM